MKLLKEIKGVFIAPFKKYYLGKLSHGAPYFWPRNFSNTIIKMRKLVETSQDDLDKLQNDWLRKSKRFKNLPMVRRSKDWIFKLFNNYYWLQIGWPICVYWHGLGWKDKYNSPRYECSPSFYIFFFNWQFCIFWNAPNGDNDKYYEMILWWLKYSNKDISKAKETWGWTDFNTKQSTWNDDYLIIK